MTLWDSLYFEQGEPPPPADSGTYPCLTNDLRSQKMTRTLTADKLWTQVSVLTFERKQNQKLHKLAGEYVLSIKSYLCLQAFLSKGMTMEITTPPDLTCV